MIRMESYIFLFQFVEIDKQVMKFFDKSFHRLVKTETDNSLS